ncbi:MAG: hypothetical protein IJI98_06845, partial [Methanosphaera sp.]|nr:hypothetical protein [Methanosphaera sp.]
IRATDLGDTLVLDKNYIYNSATDSSYSNGFTISKSIVIDCNGYSITGTNKIFTIGANNVVLKNINFKKSNNVIQWNGKNGQIQDSTFTNCEQLIVSGANLVINHTRFIGKTRSGATNLISARSDSLQVLNSNFTDFTVWYYFKTEAYSTNTLIKNCIFKGTINSGSTDIYFSMISLYGQATVEDSTFNITKTGTGNYNNRWHQVIGGSAPVVIRNCYIDAPDFNNVISFESTLTRVYDTTFKNMNSVLELYSGTSGQFMVRSGSIFDNCTFENIKGDYALTLAYPGITVSNSRFIDCKGAILMKHNTQGVGYDPNYAIVKNCNFTNSKASSTVINVANGIQVQLSNLKFTNTISGKDSIINSGVTRKISGITYNTTEANCLVDNGQDFELYTDLWVSPNPNAQGSGSGRGDLCNLTYALQMIDYGGVIHLTTGVYNDVSTRVSTLANFIGEDDNVIINNGSFLLAAPDTYVKNIVFNNTASNFILQQYNTMVNCNFTNITSNANFIGQDSGSYLKFNTIKDCYFINVKLNQLFSAASYMVGNTMDN